MNFTQMFFEAHQKYVCGGMDQFLWHIAPCPSYISRLEIGSSKITYVVLHPGVLSMGSFFIYAYIFMTRLQT